MEGIVKTFWRELWVVIPLHLLGLAGGLMFYYIPFGSLAKHDPFAFLIGLCIAPTVYGAYAVAFQPETIKPQMLLRHWRKIKLAAAAGFSIPLWGMFFSVPFGRVLQSSIFLTVIYATLVALGMFYLGGVFILLCRIAKKLKIKIHSK